MCLSLQAIRRLSDHHSEPLAEVSSHHADTTVSPSAVCDAWVSRERLERRKPAASSHQSIHYRTSLPSHTPVPVQSSARIPIQPTMADVVLFVVKILAMMFSLAMIYSPSLDMINIVRSKSTGDMALLPLVSLWISFHMWVVYDLLTNNMFPMFVTHINGEICGIVYTAIFYRYTTEKAYARKVILSALAFFVVITAYFVTAKAGVTNQSSHSVEQIAGYTTAILDVALFTSPLETIAIVLKTKSGASIPVLMCLCGAVGNTLWVLYGILADNMFVLVPCVFCTLFATLQITLYLVFNPKKAACKGASLDDAHAAKSDLRFSISPMVLADEDHLQVDVKALHNYEAVNSPRLH